MGTRLRVNERSWTGVNLRRKYIDIDENALNTILELNKGRV